jgi:hypothetical protein
MWTTTLLWFEIGIVSIVYALGSILMVHFEERTPKCDSVLLQEIKKNCRRKTRRPILSN